MNVTDLAVSIMEWLGGPGMMLVIAAEALFPPVPGEMLLPFAGVQAADTGSHVAWPIMWTTLGSILGALGMYGLGRGLGVHRARRLVGRVPLMEATDVDAAVRFFARFGFTAVALARFVPMVRTFISVPAGIERMPLAWFCAATGLGSGIWNGAFVGVGYAFGMAGGADLESFVRIYSAVLAVVGLLGLLAIARRRLRARHA